VAILNNRRPEMLVRRVQDPPPCDADYCGDQPPDGGDCTQLPDGSFSCYLTQPNVQPPPPEPVCSPVMQFFYFYSGVELDILLFLLESGLGLWGLLVSIAWDGFMYYYGC
jgi:hypothetical protein